MCQNNYRDPYTCGHVTGAVVIVNNDALMKRGLLYQPWKAWEDLHMNNLLDSKDLLVLKLYKVKFMKALIKDAALLCPWDEKTQITGQEESNSKIPAQNIVRIAEQYIRTLKISKLQFSGFNKHPEDRDAVQPVKNYLEKINQRSVTGCAIFCHAGDSFQSHFFQWLKEQKIISRMSVLIISKTKTCIRFELLTM